ncbi:MAG: hypothetical protein RL653_3646 [Pseudomonadota bacterium]|jgi:hypothetical protein
MGIPLKPVLAALGALPWDPPPRGAVSCAILSDGIRDLGLAPPSASAFRDAAAACGDAERGAVLLQVLAFALSRTPLGASLAQHRPTWRDTEKRLLSALASMKGLPVEQVPRNGFRREEVLRKFLHAFELPIDGESPAESATRLGAVDFRRLKAAMDREEVERRRVAEAWAKRKAEEAAAAPSRTGSYE